MPRLAGYVTLTKKGIIIIIHASVSRFFLYYLSLWAWHHSETKNRFHKKRLMFNQMTNEKKQEKLLKVHNIQCFEGASKMGHGSGLRGVGVGVYLRPEEVVHPLQGRNPGPLYIFDDSCSCSTGLKVGLQVRRRSESSCKCGGGVQKISLTLGQALVQTVQQGTFSSRWWLPRWAVWSTLRYTPVVHKWRSWEYL